MQQNYRKQSSAHHSQTLKPKNNSKRNLHSNNQNQTKTNSNNQNQTKTNSNKQNQTKTNSNLQNQTRTNSNLQNQTKTNSNNQNQTKTKSNNQNQTKTNSNNQNQTKTNSNNQNQTRTKSNLQNQTKTNSNLQNQTKTNSNKQNQTKTNSNNQNQTKTKSNNQNQTKTNSNNQNQTKTNSNLQNQIQIQNENEKEFVVKYFPLDENTKIIQSENCYQMKDKDFDQLLILETLSAFQRMYEMPTYDYSIYAGKSQKEIPCHLFPLMARSPFIYTLYQENNERELFLPKFEPEIVELVIEFIYKGKIEFQLEQFDQFYLLANFLEMESLKIKIEKYVRARINTTNVANVYFKSRKIKSLFLFKYSKQFIQDNAQRFVTESDVDSINHNQIIEMAELIQLAPSSKSNNLILFFFDRWIKNFITKENVFSSDEIIDPIQILKEKRTVNDVIEIINEMNKNNKFDLDQDSQFNQNSLNIHSFSNLFNEKFNQWKQEQEQKMKKLQNEMNQIKNKKENVKKMVNQLKNENAKLQNQLQNENEQLQKLQNENGQLQNQLKNEPIDNLQFQDKQNRKNIKNQFFTQFREKLNLIEKSRDNQNIQQEKLQDLDRLCFEMSKNQIVFQDLEGIKTILQTMRKFPQNRDIQYRGCAILFQISQEEKNKIAISELHGIKRVINSMTNFPKDEKIQFNACGFLWKFAINKDLKFHDKIRNLHGIERIIQLMKNFPENERIQRISSEILLCLSQNKENFNLIKKPEPFSLIQNYFNKFKPKIHNWQKEQLEKFKKK